MAQLNEMGGGGEIFFGAKWAVKAAKCSPKLADSTLRWLNAEVFRHQTGMTEKLFITNFCGLRDVELEFAPVTVFIGPQASGKSVIAKTLFFFRRLGAQLIAGAEEGLTPERIRKDCSKVFCRSFPPVNWRGSTFTLRYESHHGWAEVKYAGGDVAPDGSGLAMHLSTGYDTILVECAARRAKMFPQNADQESESIEQQWQEARREFEDRLCTLLGPWANFQQQFIPAGRSFFAQVKSSVFTQLEDGGTIDPFLVSFGKLLEQSQQMLTLQGFFHKSVMAAKRWNKFRSSLSSILGAKWIRHDGQDYLVSHDGRKVRLAQASSGQQETFPLLLLLGRFWGLRRRHGRAVYVEEPEAHIFPATQRAVVTLLVRVFRSRPDQMRLVITTHSPYVLTALNNLLHAGQCYAKSDAKEKSRLVKIIDERETLRPGELAAYALEDGDARSIMDLETGLVDAQLLDAVSTDMAKEFDRLLWEGK